MPPSDPREIQKTFKKLFFILLTLGILLGSILAVGLVKVLNEWGLTDKPQPTQTR